MALVDGKALAREVRRAVAQKIAALHTPLSLVTLVTRRTFVTERFVAIKEKEAHRLGVAFRTVSLPPPVGTEAVVHALLQASRGADGLVVQLPLAPSVEEEVVRNILPLSHDVDVYGTTAFTQFAEGRLPFVPPVVGALQEILAHHGIALAGKQVAVIGAGRLVGAPFALYARRKGAAVTVVRAGDDCLEEALARADIVVCGAGVPALVRPEMVREGVVMLDAGTSESAGKLRGDADPAVAEKAALFTPVPGGVGPVAVVKIFENLAALAALRVGAR